jgi:hypothetical protein
MPSYRIVAGAAPPDCCHQSNVVQVPTLDQLIQDLDLTSEPDSPEMADVPVGGHQPLFGSESVAPDKWLAQKERPVHRSMATLAVLGYTNKEIAERTGYSAVAVGLILRQPFAQDWMARELDRRGGNRIEQMLSREAAACVETLVELRDDPDVPAAVRRGSSTDILDRVFGKPVTRVETISANLGDLDAVRRERRMVEEELKQISNLPEVKHDHGKQTE